MRLDVSEGLLSPPPLWVGIVPKCCLRVGSKLRLAVNLIAAAY
jgi:hypothetical protein